MARDTKQTPNINREIRAREVRLIDAEGNQLGVVPMHRAIAAAEDVGLDLVEVSPNVDPPVCKIMDYGRYKYEQTKKQHEAKKKQASFQIKEIKVRPKTDTHDLNTKIGAMRKFLDRKDKVKVTVFFRGREITLSAKGMNLLQEIAQQVEDVAVVEHAPRFEGRSLFMILAPKV
nr:translation initiation factor IF-3 [Desulfosudis oleivorans]